MSEDGKRAAQEARRQKILEQGQRRLNHITFGNGYNVSRALDFDGSSIGGSLTPAASGLNPSDWQQEGAALSAKSWLALQDSPSKSPSHSVRSRSSPSKSPLQSPLAPARSAALMPISTPPTIYASDDEPPGSPVVHEQPARDNSSASSGTAASSTTLPPASPQQLPTQMLDATTSPVAPEPDATAPAAASQGTDGGSSVYSTPLKAEAPCIAQSAAVSAATSKDVAAVPANRGAAAAHALHQTAALRTFLAVGTAAAAIFGLHQLASDSWRQHSVCQSQENAPLVVLLAVLLAIFSIRYLLGGAAPPSAARAAQPKPYSGLRAVATGVLNAAAPRSFSLAAIALQLLSSLWQDVAVYLLSLHIFASISHISFQADAPWLDMLHLNNADTWRIAAGRWTL